MAYEPEKRSGVLRELEQNIFLTMRIPDKDRAKRVAQDIAWRWFRLDREGIGIRKAA